MLPQALAPPPRGAPPLPDSELENTKVLDYSEAEEYWIIQMNTGLLRDLTQNTEKIEKCGIANSRIPLQSLKSTGLTQNFFRDSEFL